MVAEAHRANWFAHVVLLTGEAEVTYKRIGRRLDKLDGVVKTERVPTVGAGYFLGYLLTDEGASLVAEAYGL